jgi:integrase
MAKTINKLTDLKIRRAAYGLLPDGDGLYLQVRGPAARSWLYRYMIAGKTREMGLGPYPAIGLEDARKSRDRCKRLRQEGLDPIATRNQERAAARLAEAQAITFSQAALSYISDKSHAWKNEKHRQQWTNTLTTYVEPLLGSVPVQAIDTKLVKQVLDPIWITKPETASRIRGRMEVILDWCKALGYRDGENPARWRGNLKDLLAAHSDVAEVEHHPALPYTELPAFMERLRGLEGLAPRALEWIILNATRANESLKAERSEISLEERNWTIPKIRMKGRRGKVRPHRVPLTSRALDVLGLLPIGGENSYLFQGVGKNKPLTDGALRTLLLRMGVENATTHGFRATFKTWAQERTRFPREVIEKALAHTIGDETEQAYDRGDLFDKRRKLMEAWAVYCCSNPMERRGNVTSISELRKAAAE